jgi:hypothetical protein
MQFKVKEQWAKYKAIFLNVRNFGNYYLERNRSVILPKIHHHHSSRKPI